MYLNIISDTVIIKKIFIVDHLEYIRDLVGVDHIGLGSDFEGFD
jgi:microsomal dipeptidase-like Zn-dependent dipeptidase